MNVDLLTGTSFSHYIVIDRIGAGGMGVVYLADDTSLDRKVVLKFLSDEIENDEAARRRFVREAKSAASLDHPYICSVHEIGEFDGKAFIAMEYVQGKTLRDAMAEDDLSVERVLRIASEIAEALADAQRLGIIHRDLKPENIMLTTGGHVKVMDFGLSKRIASTTNESSTPTASVTEGVAMGTLRYMSPEQLRGSTELDTRSDIFSFGILLYELLTGVHPFRRSTQVDTASAILTEDPPALSTYGVPESLERIVRKMLARDLAARYQTVDELRSDFEDLTAVSQIPATRSRVFGIPVVPIGIAAVIVLAILGAFRIFGQMEQTRWAREEAIPEIRDLIASDNYSEAYALALEARGIIPTDPTLTGLWPQISFPVSVQTNPEGADVYVRDYAEFGQEWTHLGQTPVADAQISRTFKRFRIELEGFAPVEFLGPAPTPIGAQISRNLTPLAEAPEGMVRVSATGISANAQGMMTGSDPIEPIELSEFWIDEFEVTNHEFKAFVDAGGYRDPSFWQEEFVREGEALSLEEAMRLFTDAAGRPGPAGWVLGEYPEGEDDLPVTGVSWYEAAAYAAFVGKSLPTIYHWNVASGAGIASAIIPLSNFGEGIDAAGSNDGLGPFGTRDMAGNAREWAWNEWEETRYILGGAHNEPIYMFTYANVQSPFDRGPTNGFRLVQYINADDPSADAARPVERVVRDYSLETPVDDALFAAYRERFSYDPVDLEPALEQEEDQEDFTKLKITYTAAYDNERVIAYLYLPKAVDPPYQTVIYFPGSGAIGIPSSETLQSEPLLVPIVQSGRALLVPIYKGTYERNDGLRSTWPNSTVGYVEYLTKWVQDFSTSVDYLETRGDIDMENLAYFGISWGGRMGAIIPAVEDRLKTAVLWLGGLASGRARPEVDQINFVTRVTVPVLMLNGRFDPLEPVVAAQVPMENLLGTDRVDKVRITYDTDHWIPLNAGLKETLDWLDRYLGSPN